MATSIHWTNETWNPLVGCSKISAGCARCYAAEAAKSARLQQFSQYQAVKDWDGTIAFVESQLLKPLSWKAPKKIFVCSMSDIFHAHVKDEWLDKIFAVMAFARQHTFQVLTKRPERMQQYLSDPATVDRIEEAGYSFTHNMDCINNWPLPNVWLGTSIENQEVVDQRIPHLLETPAAVRFLSCEPLLESVDISNYLPRQTSANLVLPHIGWVIIGGESGAKSRPCHQNWIESIVTQCQQQSVAVFVKQWGQNPVTYPYPGFGLSDVKVKLKDRKGGDMAEWPDDMKFRQFPITQG
jgi:protein gp37